MIESRNENRNIMKISLEFEISFSGVIIVIFFIISNVCGNECFLKRKL